MPLTVVGLSHSTGAPVEMRERLAFTSSGALQRALAYFKDALRNDAECVLISTCNRTEWFVSSALEISSDSLIEILLSARGEGNLDDLRPYLNERRGHKAAEHLFRVASGLDSMILGETDVARQVKEAYATATEAGLCGPNLNSLFHEALRVAKRIRTELDLGRGAFSVGHAAADVARNIFGAGSGRTVLLLGAGDMSETTARHLTSFGVSSILVANRTYDRAIQLAESLNGRAIHYDRFPEFLATADIVISSTSSPHPIVTRVMVENVLKKRRRRDPLFLIDIAVPRDIESSVGELDDVYLYDIDDLQQLIESDLAERRRRAVHAETMIHEEARAYTARQKSREAATPILNSLRSKQRAIFASELTRLQKRLPHLSPEDWKAIEAFATAVENKTLHSPTVKIKEYAAGDAEDSAMKIAAARELFGLDNEEVKPSDEIPASMQAIGERQ